MQNYGWHLLAKEVADFTNCTFFEVMDLTALEVAGLSSLIQAKAQLFKLNNTVK